MNILTIIEKVGIQSKVKIIISWSKYFKWKLIGNWILFLCLERD